VLIVPSDDRLIVWFDIDNTLYPASVKMAEKMGEKIHAFFLELVLNGRNKEDVDMEQLNKEADNLHKAYYTGYGLALRGLVHNNHGVDPLDFDRKCDGSLPLKEMIKPDPVLVKLFKDIDRTKCRVWALTNAYITHAERVLEILQLKNRTKLEDSDAPEDQIEFEDQIEGLVYCDYTVPNFECKPDPGFYRKALIQANVTDPSKCLFVDDNRSNVDAAKKEGWGRCVHFHESELGSLEGGRVEEIGSEREKGAVENDVAVISSLEELRALWPDIFKKDV
jgi:pyrimidine and pyridine-specific 5'-nucleotidase